MIITRVLWMRKYKKNINIFLLPIWLHITPHTAIYCETYDCEHTLRSIAIYI